MGSASSTLPGGPFRRLAALPLPGKLCPQPPRPPLSDFGVCSSPIPGLSAISVYTAVLWAPEGQRRPQPGIGGRLSKAPKHSGNENEHPAMTQTQQRGALSSSLGQGHSYTPFHRPRPGRSKNLPKVPVTVRLRLTRHRPKEPGWFRKEDSHRPPAATRTTVTMTRTAFRKEGPDAAPTSAHPQRTLLTRGEGWPGRDPRSARRSPR